MTSPHTPVDRDAASPGALCLRLAAQERPLDALPADERRLLELALRDAFFAASAGKLEPAALAAWRALVERVVATPVQELDGLALAFHPSARFKAVRYVERERLEPAVRALFACPAPELPALAAVFVDPQE